MKNNTPPVDFNDLRPGTTLSNGKYVIQSKIGEGGFGITYIAAHSILNRKLCIKEYFLAGRCTRQPDTKTVFPRSSDAELYQKYRQSFVREAQTLSQLNHPGIVDIIDIFDENGTSYMVMNFVEGRTLQNIVANNGPLSYETAVNYIAQVAEAVDYIHQNHILHRDIKPDNIIITPQHHAILIDFGSAREFIDDKTQAQTSILTHGYAPTEQYSTNSRKGAYTDIYAIGATMYFILTGKVPTDAAARITDPMPEAKQVNPSIPNEANRTINKAMQIMPHDRHQSIKEFLDDLRNVGGTTEPAETINDEKTIPINNIKTVVDESDEAKTIISNNTTKPTALTSNAKKSEENKTERSSHYKKVGRAMMYFSLAVLALSLIFCFIIGLYGFVSGYIVPVFTLSFSLLIGSIPIIHGNKKGIWIPLAGVIITFLSSYFGFESLHFFYYDCLIWIAFAIFVFNKNFVLTNGLADSSTDDNAISKKIKKLPSYYRTVGRIFIICSIVFILFYLYELEEYCYVLSWGYQGNGLFFWPFDLLYHWAESGLIHFTFALTLILGSIPIIHGNWRGIWIPLIGIICSNIWIFLMYIIHFVYISPMYFLFWNAILCTIWIVMFLIVYLPQKKIKDLIEEQKIQQINRRTQQDMNNIK